MSTRLVAASLALSLTLLVGCGTAPEPASEPAPDDAPSPTQTQTTPKTSEDKADTALPGESLSAEGDVWRWDADGDGTPEELTFTFVDNGDEAPCVLIAELASSTVDAVGYIDFGAEVRDVRLIEDEDGSHLFVVYTTGWFDMDGSDGGPGFVLGDDAQCTMRLANGELVVEQVEEQHQGQ